MVVFVADDEKLILNYNCRIIKELLPEAEVYAFSESTQLLREAERILPDIAFLDINMPVVTGVEAAARLKQMNAKVNIIFATAYDSYKSEAMDMFASGYITKPIVLSEVKRMLDNLRYPVTTPSKKVIIKAFGAFSVYKEGKPVFFHRAKAKEILAYLVSVRGRSVSYGEIAAVVFEDKNYTAPTKKLMDMNLRSLQDDVSAAGLTELLIRGEQCLAFNAQDVRCDLYDYLDGIAGSGRLYNGQYMEPYRWGEGFKKGAGSRE